MTHTGTHTHIKYAQRHTFQIDDIYFAFGMQILLPQWFHLLLDFVYPDTAPICENYAKVYFDTKHLEKALNRGWQNFWCSFIFKKWSFWPISDTALIF